MILLDCTLRDGGYYNDWVFSKSLVNDYINKISKSGVKIVELALTPTNYNIKTKVL
jgi:4-hydroxy 2-oxovalerate aldolase